MREKKKKHPLFKEISGWKVKYTPFFFTILGPDFVARKVPPLPDILATRMRSFRPLSGEGPGPQAKVQEYNGMMEILNLEVNILNKDMHAKIVLYNI